MRAVSATAKGVSLGERPFIPRSVAIKFNHPTHAAKSDHGKVSRAHHEPIAIDQP
jgi:hypothetical protein